MDRRILTARREITVACHENNFDEKIPNYKQIDEALGRLPNLLAYACSSIYGFDFVAELEEIFFASVAGDDYIYARRDILDIVAEGRKVHLFWVRAHSGTTGNERADELTRKTALKKKTAKDYDRFPLS
ncbi:hypothetical protein EVAR_32849_1 [Eumeta japonica]|uniref:RNase H type-1 domain-containing protein n=1 Tax=Eumeta variegata TaxID=151549 RepID=A0A4C1WE57_EUMVA|nr:hypothetical protein EVAR_32849_1 [Eumeta japonica]